MFVSLFYRHRQHPNGCRAAGKTALAYRQTLPDAHNCELLEKALQSGAITQLEHIAQHSLYYESIDKAIEAERDYQKAYAELTAYDL